MSRSVAHILATVFLALHHPAARPNQTAHITQPDQLTPAPQQTQLEIAKLDPPLQLAPSLVLRGTVPSDQLNATQLAPAFAAYTQSDYPLAAQRFSQLTKQFPRADIPFLYLGITQLLQNDSAAALPDLARAEYLAQGSHKDSAAWYHALAVAKPAHPEAPALLRTLCQSKESPYAYQACQLEKAR
ncbi:MAG TPA: hypothetical protein VIX42_04870 [Edaphobacter sp.]